MTPVEHKEICSLEFHSNLYLYALVAPNRRSTGGEEDGCVMVTSRLGDAPGIMTFLSPVDAWLYFGDQAPAPGFQPVPFETVNAKHFLRLNQGMLRVFICNGFAATGNVLRTKPNDGGLIPSISCEEFYLDEESRDHFGINFSDRLLDEIQSTYDRCGLHTFPDHLHEMRNWSAEESRQAYDEAVKFFPKTKPWSNESEMTHTAIYDSVALEWQFVRVDADVAS